MSMILKELLLKKKQEKSNKDVIMAVEEESAENPSNFLGTVEKLIAEQNRHHKAHIDLITQALNKEHKKNSLCQGRVGQPSKANKNVSK